MHSASPINKQARTPTPVTRQNIEGNLDGHDTCPSFATFVILFALQHWPIRLTPPVDNVKDAALRHFASAQAV